MFKKITRQEFLDIVFANNQKIVEKSIKKGNSFITNVFVGVNIIAKREITSAGTEYFKKV